MKKWRGKNEMLCYKCIKTHIKPQDLLNICKNHIILTSYKEWRLRCVSFIYISNSRGKPH